MQIVSFCFDDGFRATADKARAIFGRFGWAPCLCILAAPEKAEDAYIKGTPIADWSYWREAQAAGCEIAPHGYAHENLARCSFAEATASVERCFDIFMRELPGFLPSEQVFHTAYLSAPPEILSWLRKRVLGVRTGLRRAGVTSIEEASSTRLLDCVSYGHDTTDRLFSERIAQFVSGEDGILTIVLHGLDGEGWGPLRSATLEGALAKLQQARIDVVPCGQLLSNLISPQV
ncbi:MAG TPA: polysaccharide deacetylase family protein [Rhizomicrobium sp.]|jgi:peptidoglycan/xylan/chitin deacetylase (PgdA/CDA1 family)